MTKELDMLKEEIILLKADIAWIKKAIGLIAFLVVTQWGIEVPKTLFAAAGGI